MTGNPWAGEVALVLDGQRHVMRLTLGALASLEAALSAEGLADLIARFEGGGFATRDVVAVLLAGLRGGGWGGSAQALLDGEIEGGAMGATRAAAALLGRSFALPGGSAMTLDWPALMRAGLRGLGLSPSAFWALTPAELAFLLGAEGGGRPMDRAALNALAARFPDEGGDDGRS